MKNPEVLTGGRNAKQDVRNNKSKNQFVKRSNVMKYNRFIKIAATIFVALTIVVSGAFAQGNAVLSGTVANTGTIKVKAALSGTVTTLDGTVEFNGAAQTIPGGYTFNKLTGSGTGAKSIGIAGTGASVTVKDTLTANGVTVSVSNLDSLHLGLVSNLTPIYTIGVGSFVATSGTVVYGGDGAQNIYGTTYHNLYVRAKTFVGTKTAGGNIIVTDSLTNLAHITFDFGSNSFTGTSAAIVNTGTLKSSSTVTVDATAVIGGTFEYAAAGVQTVAPASYTNLTLSNTGIKTFTSGQTYSIAGIYTPGVAANVYTGSTINYNSAVAGQAIADVDYANLTFSNGTKTWALTATRAINGNLTLNASSATTVSGAFALNVSGNVSLSSNLTVANAVVFANAGSTVTGALNDIIGTVTRTHVFAAATPYQFNNQYTTVALAVPPVAQSFSMTVSPGVNPLGYTVNHSVNRKFVPTFTSLGTGTADVQLAYLTGEIGTLTESKLKEFHNGISSANKLAGGLYTRMPVGVTFGYVKLPAITTAFLSNQELALDDEFNQFMTIASADWNLATTWDAGAVPSATDDAIINTTGVTLNAAGHVNNLVINATKDLTLGTATSALQVDGGLTNNGGLTLSNASSTLVVTGTFNNVLGSTLTNAGTITVQ
ncbi:MAG: hypothetical protein ABSA44_12120 [Bacteroidota bacterium]|jgi:hypothetical protein